MQEGEARREQLLQMLKDSTAPISGSALARALGVSRQVIVQDIALLRAVNKNILATTKGYVLYSQQTEACHRIFCVNHSDDAIADELNTIVDNGGKVLDVIIEHEIYGQITANLILENRRDVAEFCDRLKHSNAKPLNIIAEAPTTTQLKPALKSCLTISNVHFVKKVTLFAHRVNLFIWQKLTRHMYIQGVFLCLPLRSF